ncbi:hypothetical protein ATZ33_10445 [Enterococcus silesiacus]|uniref:Uncharacterized protein n=1 Tax=Enterococcus silesiacus TaxID=332949 RepID=A0A0S3KC17_9ENTE|nr:hypothetical protein [Enterococcus silesiacus]ALS01778.1 hypothetical protein ATZ33_10445 [Enterococcus silesiacus]OJG92037.1 hypothetical protein RV15_GL003422 [Enterococcus silesiacus]
MDNEKKIIEWLSVCPDFEISKIEENQIMDKSLIWGKLPNKSFSKVSFAELKHFLVDSYEWNREGHFQKRSSKG